MTENKYITLNDCDFFEVKGKDKKAFLQGMITNDIEKINKNTAIYSALLSPQGKFLADFFIIDLNDSYLFETKKDFSKIIIDKLNIYKLRSDIEIIRNSSFISLSIFKRTDIFKDLKNQGMLKKIKEGYIFVDPRNSKLGLKGYIEKNYYQNFFEKYSIYENKINEYNKLRIKNCIPDSLIDLEINKSLLLENNFDNINAISWEKGCYVGQEITARMKYRALLKKNLRPINIVEGNVRVKDKIFFNDKEIGVISSIESDIGLAMVKIKESNVAYENNSILQTKLGKVIIKN